MKQLIKVLSVTLCVMIVLLSAVTTAFAFTLSSAPASGEKGVKATPDEAKKVFKDESVYVMASADGTVEKIIVSDWIQNKDHRDTITDFSNLKNIKNLKGDESYTLNEENMQVWNTGGKDLYVEGEGEEPLPVDLSVSYKLDGKSISPDDLKGKSGRVTIRFDYENKEYRTVEIDGKKEKIYVPFVMLTGLLLDGDKFSDVEVTNGKVISDGDRTIVAGLAFPGLSDNLKLNFSELEIPDYVEITAETEDFELGSTITIAVNDVFNDIDTSDLDQIDDMKDSMAELDTAMGALIDGSSALYDGLSTLLEKSGDLADGIDQLYSGAQALTDGAAQLNAGAVQIDTGALDLSLGLSQLSDNNAALRGGSQQVFSSILAAAQKTLSEQGLEVKTLTGENYQQVLGGLIEQLSDENVRAQAEAAAKDQVSAAVEAERDTVTAAVTAAVRESVEAKVRQAVEAQIRAAVIASLGYTVEEYEAAVSAGLVDDQTVTQVEAAVTAQLQSEEIEAGVQAKTDENMNSDEVKALIASTVDEKIEALIEEQLLSDTVQNAIKDALSKAKSGREQIKNLITQLDAYSAFDTGIGTYTGGVSSAAQGAAALSKGTAQLSKGSEDLKTGSKALSDGILTLKNGVPALVEGVSKLTDGSMQLSDGLKTFNEEGISKITSFFSDDLSTLSARLRATVDVSKSYKTYSGLSDEMDGEVKFIYKTASIE